MQTAKVTRPDNLTSEENLIFDRIVGRDKQSLRSSKPKLKDDNDVIGGKASYVWRMLCFYLGRRNQDVCLPMCADFDIIAPATKNEFRCYQCTEANPGGEQEHTFEIPAATRKVIRSTEYFPEGREFTLITCPIHGEESQPDSIMSGYKSLPSVNIYQIAEIGKTSSANRRAVCKELEDGIISKVVAVSKVSYNSGFMQWGRAFGTIDDSVGSTGDPILDMLS